MRDETEYDIMDAAEDLAIRIVSDLTRRRIGKRLSARLIGFHAPSGKVRFSVKDGRGRKATLKLDEISGKFADSTNVRDLPMSFHSPLHGNVKLSARCGCEGSPASAPSVKPPSAPYLVALFK